jgi:hypothetical protein
MIGLPSGTRIWLATGVTDMRRGMDGPAALVQSARTMTRWAVADWHYWISHGYCF